MVPESGGHPGNSEAPRKARRLPAEKRREQILEKAAQIFAERGLAGAKIRVIAAACGVTEAVLYKHFPSKEELFRASLESKVATHDVEGFLRDLPGDLSIGETFKRIATQILEVGLADPIVHRLLLTATLAGTPETHGLYVSWRIPFITRLETVIRAGIDRGELREVDPLLTARAFVGLVMDCVLSCNLWAEMGQPEYEPEALIENNVPTFVRGLLKS